ncbi:Wnt-4 protein precursor, putative [Brugia malayi]|uniref:Protein Wnt n=2 Tax=Brugia malayi TaxID=6279 RepID=A0A0H5S894_BRUMA|nr:Wnt-4 protein precursor, putative [Brugia malayi]CRZ24806.1 BMA-CWN-1 [Brugia malayi]VIO93183.1 Wnt-4 protein precursor, putative [Brugia malayi]
MNYIIFLLLFLDPFVDYVIAISWLALSLSSSKIDRLHPQWSCRHLHGLTRKQLRFCRRNIEQMDSIRAGAQLAYSECQYQFQQRRWNCSLINPNTKEVYGDMILNRGTREAAFVHAISSAGIAYRITRDCSKGLIDKCGCDLSALKRTDQFNWNGCSDNVRYGVAVSRAFVDAAERGKNQSLERKIMNLHNNNAGRQVLELNTRKQCKCHGLSGSCEMKTCWKSMPTFREVGKIIKDKFDGATEVAIVEEDSKPIIVRKNVNFRRHTKADLVYLESSPDYCEPDPEYGILGTHGRLCNVSSHGIDGCDLMCCYRGFDTRVRKVMDRCNCKFHYCCRVICQPCEKVIEEHICK